MEARHIDAENRWIRPGGDRRLLPNNQSYMLVCEPAEMCLPGPLFRGQDSGPRIGCTLRSATEPVGPKSRVEFCYDNISRHKRRPDTELDESTGGDVLTEF